MSFWDVSAFFFRVYLKSGGDQKTAATLIDSASDIQSPPPPTLRLGLSMTSSVPKSASLTRLNWIKNKSQKRRMWVIAPHEFDVQAGYVVFVFLINHTVLALSEAGILYQMKLSENSQPRWVEYTPIQDSIKSRVISHNIERIWIYF
ncbi:unnamed protein product [Lactuca saligna]|uniref:Uncharacterized protein n=1 Tax=Lactuca saligna TaxID=75948 RepID=A0AA35Y7U6_LACSI|nr:unnamed protein product [Lactuca saligna]